MKKLECSKRYVFSNKCTVYFRIRACMRAKHFDGHTRMVRALWHLPLHFFPLSQIGLINSRVNKPPEASLDDFDRDGEISSFSIASGRERVSPVKFKIADLV